MVADGVGGWATQGVNPGLFSAELTASMLRHHQESHEMTPYELGQKACLEAGSKFDGSATLVALGLADHETVNTMNLGDSGYALYHTTEDDHLEMYYRSKSQQKMFNFPYQCGSIGDPATDAEQF